MDDEALELFSTGNGPGQAAAALLKDGQDVVIRRWDADGIREDIVAGTLGEFQAGLNEGIDSTNDTESKTHEAQSHDPTPESWAEMAFFFGWKVTWTQSRDSLAVKAETDRAPDTEVDRAAHWRTLDLHTDS